MNDIKHVWTVLCRNSVTDSETNNISLLDVLEKLEVAVETKDLTNSNLSGKVIVPFSFEIVTLWARSDFNDKKERNMEAKTEIFDPGGKKLGEMISSFTLASQFRRMRGRGKLSNIGLTSSGKYVFKISGKESGENNFIEVAEIPLEVEIKKKNILKKDLN